MQLLKEVPLLNDVMLPSTSEKLLLPLSPLPPSEPLHATSTTPHDTKVKHYMLDSSSPPANSSVVNLTTVHLLMCTGRDLTLPLRLLRSMVHTISVHVWTQR